MECTAPNWSGTYLSQSGGGAEIIASILIQAEGFLGPVGILGCIYLFTMIFTELVTNNAAAALMFPIAISAATAIGASPRPFVIAVCIAASASFATPVGYQTNLLVQGMGRYRFRDYLKVGLPMNLIAMTIGITLIPVFWSF
ncbi:MAG: SLC13 family permease [Spirochaetia bacterium]